MAKAQTTLKEVTASDGHVFLPDDVAFTDLPMRSMSGHKQWTDAYLLRLAHRHSLRLASLESRMSNLDDPANSGLPGAAAVTFTPSGFRRTGPLSNPWKRYRWLFPSLDVQTPHLPGL